MRLFYAEYVVALALNASGWNCSKSRGTGAAGSDGRVKYKQEAMRQEVRNMVL